MSWQKVKVLTSKQNATKFTLLHFLRLLKSRADKHPAVTDSLSSNEGKKANSFHHMEDLPLNPVAT